MQCPTFIAVRVRYLEDTSIREQYNTPHDPTPPIPGFRVLRAHEGTIGLVYNAQRQNHYFPSAELLIWNELELYLPETWLSLLTSAENWRQFSLSYL